MTDNQKKAAEKIYGILMTQDFADFYNDGAAAGAPFEKHVEGDEDAPSKKEILELIIHLFRIQE